eukprot:TRINITY_DN10801_c0_g1_i1.p1 TRINITY_DN10801_c0_g1~~TRINITY_DN10801_c0_g1_i1.p1  ORF type:complete len:380 (+),score=81.55 TRINITY_DN10801_c0_g1_i1:156-1295(+)
MRNTTALSETYSSFDRLLIVLVIVEVALIVWLVTDNVSKEKELEAVRRIVRNRESELKDVEKNTKLKQTKVLYLFSTPNWGEGLRERYQQDRRALVLTYHARSSAADIYLPHSTWAERRNVLLSHALRLERDENQRFEYFVFVDNSFMLNPREEGNGGGGGEASKLARNAKLWAEFEEFLFQYEPAVGVMPLAYASAPNHELLAKRFASEDVTPVYLFEPNVNAFHRQAIPLLLPYYENYDDISSSNNNKTNYFPSLHNTNDNNNQEVEKRFDSINDWTFPHALVVHKAAAYFSSHVLSYNRALSLSMSFDYGKYNTDKAKKHLISNEEIPENLFPLLRDKDDLFDISGEHQNDSFIGTIMFKSDRDYSLICSSSHPKE